MFFSDIPSGKMSSFAGNALETQDRQNNEGQGLPHLNLEQFEQHCIICYKNIQV